MASTRSGAYQQLLDLLRGARTTAGLTQNQLAALLGKRQSYVSKYENGERRLDVIELLDVCRHTGADPHQLINMLSRPPAGGD